MSKIPTDLQVYEDSRMGEVFAGRHIELGITDHAQSDSVIWCSWRCRTRAAASAQARRTRSLNQ